MSSRSGCRKGAHLSDFIDDEAKESNGESESEEEQPFGLKRGVVGDEEADNPLHLKRPKHRRVIQEDTELTQKDAPLSQNSGNSSDSFPMATAFLSPTAAVVDATAITPTSTTRHGDDFAIATPAARKLSLSDMVQQHAIHDALRPAIKIPQILDETGNPCSIVYAIRIKGDSLFVVDFVKHYGNHNAFSDPVYKRLNTQWALERGILKRYSMRVSKGNSAIVRNRYATNNREGGKDQFPRHVYICQPREGAIQKLLKELAQVRIHVPPDCPRRTTICPNSRCPPYLPFSS